MYQLLEYYGKWNGFKSGFSRKPAWAKFFVGIVALPGLVLVLLSILAFLVSLIVLFLPASLAYRLVNKVTGSGSSAKRPSGFGETDFVAEQQGGGFTPADERVNYDEEAEAAPVAPVVATPDPDTRPRRQIEVKIVE